LNSSFVTPLREISIRSAPILKEFGGEVVPAGLMQNLPREWGFSTGVLMAFEECETALAFYNVPTYQPLSAATKQLRFTLPTDRKNVQKPRPLVGWKGGI